MFKQQLDDSEVQAYAASGCVVLRELLEVANLPSLHDAFEDLFHGKFETGIRPDEINWQVGKSDPSLTRQICNAWRANRAISNIILSEPLGAMIGQLTGWPGVRVMIDNVIWKPPGARPLGFHQDNAYLDWLSPSELVSCWIALDDVDATLGSFEYLPGSHRWPLSEFEGEFHGPDDYHAPAIEAAKEQGVVPRFMTVDVPAGGGSIHHGNLWHGSGVNRSSRDRRALVLHAISSETQWNEQNLDAGIGPIYRRYKKSDNDQLDEAIFPIIWRQDGYRSAQLAGR